MVSRKTANLCACVVAAAIVLLGLGLWAKIGPPFNGPTTTTKVVEIGTGSGTGKTTVETKQPAGQNEPSVAGEETTKTIETPSGSPSGKRTTTIEEGSRSFVERVLGKSGLALLQLGVIALAAFLAAAFVQRVLIGDYALKIGPLDIGAAQEGKEDALIKLGAELADNIKALKAEEAKLAAVSAKQSSTAAKVATILSTLAELEEHAETRHRALDERVQELEK